jgi:hypothetical protein
MLLKALISRNLYGSYIYEHVSFCYRKKNMYPSVIILQCSICFKIIIAIIFYLKLCLTSSPRSAHAAPATVPPPRPAAPKLACRQLCQKKMSQPKQMRSPRSKAFQVHFRTQNQARSRADLRTETKARLGAPGDDAPLQPVCCPHVFHYETSITDETMTHKRFSSHADDYQIKCREEKAEPKPSEFAGRENVRLVGTGGGLEPETETTWPT